MRDFSRQSALVPSIATPIDIIGCGAIGRQLALQIAAMGADSLNLRDFDTVGAENCSVQGYAVRNIGLAKTAVLRSEIRAFDPSIVVAAKGKYSGERLHNPTFLCADSMICRKNAVENAARSCPLFDCRMLGEYVEVYALTEYERRERWLGDWFTDRQANPAPCGAKSTIYSASYCAAIALSQFAAYLRGDTVDYSLTGFIGENHHE